MSRFTALLLAGIIFCQAFHNAGVLGYWLVNRAYITSAFCENRDKPQLHCDGKCYLRKRLADEGDPAPVGTHTIPVLKKGSGLSECLIPMAALFSVPVIADIARNLPSINCRSIAGFPDIVFHPPSRRA